MPFGRLYGIFNAKTLYFISITLFLVGSALCGAAPNMTVMIIGRVIAGIGGNGMYFGVVTLLSVNTTDQERPTYLALMYVFRLRVFEGMSLITINALVAWYMGLVMTIFRSTFQFRSYPFPISQINNFEHSVDNISRI